MRIHELNLRNYRNYDKASVRFEPGINLILGNNAQGKTNLLESLVYLSLTRSFRINEDEKLIRDGCEYAMLECTADQQRLKIILHPKGKSLFLNKVPIRKSSEFIGKLNVVLFTPDDLGIFQDSPRERRKVINQEITKISSRYLTELNQYMNLLKDRNLLLKREKPDEVYLDTLDEKMIELSGTIIEQRKKFITKINEVIGEEFRGLSGMQEKIEVRYESCVKENTEEDLAEMYRNSRRRDLETHVTGNGIHREDMTFLMNGENVIYCASQGQKRMIILAFKLALMRYIEEMTGQKAVVLLDDVFSELDLEKQKRLIQRIRNTEQCIITAAGIPSFLKSENTAIYLVNDGEIRRAGAEYE